jgi:hypothetical protein
MARGALMRFDRLKATGAGVDNNTGWNPVVCQFSGLLAALFKQ